LVLKEIVRKSHSKTQESLEKQRDIESARAAVFFEDKKVEELQQFFGSLPLAHKGEVLKWVIHDMLSDTHLTLIETLAIEVKDSTEAFNVYNALAEKLVELKSDKAADAIEKAYSLSNPNLNGEEELRLDQTSLNYVRGLVENKQFARIASLKDKPHLQDILLSLACGYANSHHIPDFNQAKQSFETLLPILPNAAVFQALSKSIENISDASDPFERPVFMATCAVNRKRNTPLTMDEEALFYDAIALVKQKILCSDNPERVDSITRLLSPIELETLDAIYT